MTSILTKIALKEVPDEITNCARLEEWGRYIQSEKSPIPKDVAGSPYIFSMMGHSRDEDDPAPLGSYDPDSCYEVMMIISDLPEIIQRVLYAYYCQWPGSIRKCSKFMPVGDGSRERLSEREFSLKVGMAQGLVLGRLSGSRS